MNYGLVVSLIHVLIVAPILYYAGICLKDSKKCMKGFDVLLITFAFVTFIYHGYKLIMRVRNANETFVNSTGKVEEFTPFSFPYQNESSRYYSYHDTEHTRNCNCEHNNGKTQCQLTDMCETKNKEGFVGSLLNKEKCNCGCGCNGECQGMCRCAAEGKCGCGTKNVNDNGLPQVVYEGSYGAVSGDVVPQQKTKLYYTTDDYLNAA